MLILDNLQHSPTLFVTVCVVLGLLVGSFLNVVIHRLPKMMEREWRQNCAELNGEPVDSAPAYNLVVPRSACPACARPIRAHENLPVISYLMLRGRCAGCKTRISIRYPLVELLTGLLSGVTAAHFGYGLQGGSALVLIWALVALTFIDFDTQYLPDDITQPLLWLGLLVNIPGTFTSLQASLIGAVAGYLSLWSVYWVFKLITGKEGMGYGDFKLLAALGAWLGWTMLPIIILLSSLVGAIVGFGLILIAKRGKDVPIPFGPYLAGGGLIALFAGQRLVQLYLGGI